MNNRKLVLVLACRNQGSRLYGKPLQNLSVVNKVKIIDNILDCLIKVDCISQMVLAVSNQNGNSEYENLAKARNIKFIYGDENDVLNRLIVGANFVEATDVFRVTSESPFPYFEAIADAWDVHKKNDADATFMDDVIDGCGFEIIKKSALVTSHLLGDVKHRSELCTLYIRENFSQFKVQKLSAPNELIRKDLRLTVDNPEDLIMCREVYNHFRDDAPCISIARIVEFLDKNPNLKNLVSRFTEEGYSTMYL